MTTETYQCDACAEIVPRSQVKSGMPSAGVEGTFCAKCRGVDPEDEDEAEEPGAAFWRPLIEKRGNPNHVVVKNCHYIIGPEDSSIRRNWRGFRGDRYVIKFHDGRTVTSTNLWCQGTIPAAFRDQLPDNAEFVKE